jgi:3-methyladenine DNA glycosylase AlkD
MSELNEIITLLKSHASEANREGMKRYGINTDNALGIPLPFLRNLARQHRNKHDLALQLWGTGIHDARMLATMIDDARQVTGQQMEEWVMDFNSWDICDQCCSNLFGYTPFALQKIWEWTERDEEFVKRAGFVLIACLAVHDKKADDTVFKSFLPVIIEHSTDPRNFVRKAVNWALRQIGKRNLALYNEALQLSQALMNSDDRTARWIGSDANRELTGKTAINRMLRNQAKMKH